MSVSICANSLRLPKLIVKALKVSEGICMQLSTRHLLKFPVIIEIAGRPRKALLFNDFL